MVTSVSSTFIFAMQILMLWLLNPLQIYKHSRQNLSDSSENSYYLSHLRFNILRPLKTEFPLSSCLPTQFYQCGHISEALGCKEPVAAVLYRDFFRKTKTSDFFGQKYGGFASKVRRFASKKSDVLHFPYTTTKKIFCENVLHFLHPFTKLPLCTGFFGCRMGCRMLLLGVGFGAKHCQKV